MENRLNARDIARLKAFGIVAEEVARQAEAIKTGNRPLAIERPCTCGDGIVRLDPAQHERYWSLHERGARQG